MECPNCGERCGNKASMSIHRQKKHGFPPKIVYSYGIVDSGDVKIHLGYAETMKAAVLGLKMCNLSAHKVNHFFILKHTIRWVDGWKAE